MCKPSNPPWKPPKGVEAPIKPVQNRHAAGRVEEELREVQPLLDAARTAVGGIKSEHLTEIRSLRMAPDAIRCG
jgi:dynein heavy chain 2